MKYLKNITDEQVNYLYKAAFSGLIGHSSITIIVTIMLMTNNKSFSYSIFIWMLIQFVIILARAITVKIYNNGANRENTSLWLIAYTIGGLLTGVAWGTVFLLLNNTSSSSHEFLMVAVVMGLTAAAISTLGSVFITYMSFAIPTMSIGIFWMLNHQGRLHIATAVMLMLALVYLISTAYKYSKFMTKTISQNAELKASGLDIIKHLSVAGEYRDNDTANHVIRMSKYCEALAKKAGYNKKFCETILYASPMHDVGKIGIPDNILLKPGKLSIEEFEIMKKHSEIGASILNSERSEIIKMAKIIAATHHEKYDGSGYPKGLKAEEIPIEGRIAAICDVFDALTSERPYKQAWQVEKALDYIKEQSGKHFDPDLSKHFLDIIDEVLVLKEKYKDGSRQKLSTFM